MKHKRDNSDESITFDDVLACLGMVAILSLPVWLFYLIEYILTTFFGA